MQREKQRHIVIPEGTKVLTRPGGRVGVVAHSPLGAEHSYRLRFATGVEESYRRADLTIFKHLQAEVPGVPDSTDLYKFVIYRCIVGSTAYGLSREDSDNTSAVATVAGINIDKTAPVASNVVATPNLVPLNTTTTLTATITDSLSGVASAADKIDGGSLVP